MEGWYDQIRKLVSQKIKIEMTFHPEPSFMASQQIQELLRQGKVNRALHRSHEEHVQRLKRGFNPHMN